MREDLKMTAGLFGENYYLRGIESGLSNYVDYSWKPQVTIPCVQRMMAFLGAVPNESVFDWGCARGFYVRALRELGFHAWGYDISEWAIINCDPTVSDYVSNIEPLAITVDWVVSKDCLEHIPFARLPVVVQKILKLCKKGALIVVPLCADAHNGQAGAFINPRDNADSTHVICWTLTEWVKFIQSEIDLADAPFTVQGGYKLPGVKTAADPYPCSCAFLTIRRIQ